MATPGKTIHEQLEELNQERFTLARLIHELEDGHSEELRGTPQKLTASHVIVSQKMNGLFETSSPRKDPLKTLPAELWTQIVKMAAGDGPSTASITSMCHVSRTWSQLIIREPSFWTSITAYAYVGESLETAKARVSTNLERSSTLRLRLYVDVASPDWAEGFANVVQPHADRVERFVATPQSPWSSKVRFGYPPMPRFLNLRVLEWHDLVEDTESPTIWPILQDIAHVEEVQGIPIAKPHISSDFFPRLRSLEVDDHPNQVMAQLERMKSIRSIRFTSRGSLAPLQGCDTDLTGHKLQWTQLDYSFSDIDPNGVLLTRLSLTLSMLTVALDIDHLPTLCAVLCTLTRLESLSCRIRCARGMHPLEPPSSLSSSIRHCDLHINYIIPPYDWDSDIQDDPALNVFVASFLCQFPSLETLVVNTCGQPCSISLEHHPHLRSIRASQSVIPICRPQTHLTHLRDMALTCDINNVNYNAYPSVERLALRFAMDAWNSMKRLPFERLYLTRWTCLAVLDIEMRGYTRGSSIRFDLPALRILRILARGDITTFVCHELAMQHESIPSLEDIQFVENHPEWDVLFITLERRILSTFRSLKIIKSISLPCIPPPFIARPLVERLRGLLTPRPTSFELSVDRLADKLGDMTLSVVLDPWIRAYIFYSPGCERCIKLYQACSEPGKTSAHIARGESSQSRKSLPIYPKTDKEVVETWMTRSWEAWWLRAPDYRRTTACDRHFFADHLRKYTLSEYTDPLIEDWRYTRGSHRLLS